MAFTILTLLSSSCATAGLKSSRSNQIEVQGHRGARARFPENTLPALQHALAVGADWIEFDLVVTRDRKLVLSHNHRISSRICLGPDGRRFGHEPLVFAMLFDDVRKYDCGAVRNPDFPRQTAVPGTPMPTLEEVLDWLENDPNPRAREIKLNVELKIDPDHPADTVQPEEFALLVVGLLKRREMLDRSIIQSFDYRVLREIKRLDESVYIAALTENAAEDLVATASDLQATTLSPFWRQLNRTEVRNLQAMGVLVAPWTVNNPADWDQVIALGVDSIITDDPEALLTHLRGRGLHD